MRKNSNNPNTINIRKFKKLIKAQYAKREGHSADSVKLDSAYKNYLKQY